MIMKLGPGFTKLCQAHLNIIGIMCIEFHLENCRRSFEPQHFTANRRTFCWPPYYTSSGLTKGVFNEYLHGIDFFKLNVPRCIVAQLDDNQITIILGLVTW